MPVINPDWVAWKRTPNSMAWPSFSFDVSGPSVGLNIVHGHTTGAEGPTVITTTFCVPSVSMLPKSSKLLLLIVTVPSAVGVQLKLQLVVPLATFHVAPPSTETS